MCQTLQPSETAPNNSTLYNSPTGVRLLHRQYNLTTTTTGTSFGGGQGGHLLPPEFEKFSLCVFAHTIFFFYILPPPRKLVKILPPLEKTEMTFLYHNVPSMAKSLGSNLLEIFYIKFFDLKIG